MTDSLLQNLETSFFNQALKDQLLSASWFKPLTLAGKKILPIVQGGMGVGVSAHSLAGAVARENAMGTIASIDLRHHHPDLMEQTERCRDHNQRRIAHRWSWYSNHHDSNGRRHSDHDRNCKNMQDGRRNLSDRRIVCHRVRHRP